MMEKPNTPRTVRLRGVTLIEAVLYISIALALIVGGLVFYRQASFASDFNSLNRLLSSTVVEARIFTRDHPRPIFPPTPLITIGAANFESFLISNGSIPSTHLDMTQPAGSRIRSPFGGTIGFIAAIYSAAVGGASTVAVVLQDLPVEACARLSTSSTAGRMSFATGLQSGNTHDNTSNSGNQAVAVGQTVTTAGTKCKTSDTDGDGKVFLSLIFNYIE
ncbi:MAG: hypothetical protein IOD05_09510 [Rhodobacter sp.]|nr:hypothetical protein [Rhodobacter sp.]MCA3494165.1 hypothetical protein [Rhodobacter sp.]MCA3500548.1 hypothetical protein [Rhodobacter sp.]MCA3503467.1 hypothetical protein [Rhodobacter sp.]MCA3518434.1 hypothetical protein [Rhodobacter sp.]